MSMEISSVGEDNVVPFVKKTMEIGKVTGEVLDSDILTPRMNIVQSIGSLSEDFAGGSIVLSKTISLYVPQKDGKASPVELVLLSADKYYEETIAYDPDVFPAKYATLEEVARAGKSIKFGLNDEKPTAREVMDLLCFIRCPAGCSPEHFEYEFEGEGFSDVYTMAIWSIRSSAFRELGKRIMSNARNKFGLLASSYMLSTKRVEAGKNLIWMPTLTTGKMLTTEFREYIMTSLNRE